MSKNQCLVTVMKHQGEQHEGREGYSAVGSEVLPYHSTTALTFEGEILLPSW